MTERFEEIWEKEKINAEKMAEICFGDGDTPEIDTTSHGGTSLGALKERIERNQYALA